MTGQRRQKGWTSDLSQGSEGGEPREKRQVRIKEQGHEVEEEDGHHEIGQEEDSPREVSMRAESYSRASQGETE